ncbi:MAG TPA: hypothetical protein PKC28_08655 [Bdellovibrionales bacterium]|nr:hypothetical protein [Bdellovibrionales bacterium]
MKKSWDVKSVEMIPMRVESEEYSQRLDELAEFVYRYFCQLQEDQTLAPVTEIADQSVGRTGTDG